MADKKITQLNELIVPSLDDMIVIVDDPMGAPETKKISLLNIIGNGWIPASESWTVASLSSFTTPGDHTRKYTKATKLWVKNSAEKFCVVIGSSYNASLNNTLVTVTGNQLSVGVPVTENYYSYAANPSGFPLYFAYTPDPLGLTSPVINARSGYYWFAGGICRVRFVMDIQSWSGQTGYILASLPFAPQAINLAGVATYFRTGGSTEQGTHGSYLYSGACAMENSGVNNLISWEASARITYSGVIDIIP